MPEPECGVPDILLDLELEGLLATIAHYAKLSYDGTGNERPLPEQISSLDADPDPLRHMGFRGWPAKVAGCVSSFEKISGWSSGKFGRFMVLKFEKVPGMSCGKVSVCQGGSILYLKHNDHMNLATTYTFNNTLADSWSSKISK